MKPRTGMLWLFALGLVVLLGLAAACGDGGEEGATPEGETPAPQGETPAPQDETPAATPADSRVELPKKTIGLLNINLADAAAAELQKEVEAAVAAAGWELISVDGAGDPTLMAQGMQQLVNQNVDAVLDLAVDPVLIQAGLEAAEAKNIPVVNFAGLVTPSPLLAAQIAPSDYTLASLIDYYLINQLGGSGKVFALTSNIIPAFTNRYELFKTELETLAPDIEIVGEHEVDFANFFADTTKAVSAAIQSNPDLDAIWAVAAPMPAPVAEAIKAAGKTDEIISVGFYAVPQNLELIRSGEFTAVADFSLEQAAWNSVDVLVQHFGADQPIESVRQFDVPLQYTVVSASNVPASGPYQYPFDYKSAILEQWKVQFSNVPGS